MATTQEAPATKAAGYRLEGSLLEVCSCETLCPCWIGEDPDYGTCQSVVAYHLDRGDIGGVDVGGLTLVSVVHIPGNVLAGNWRQLVFVDESATEAQEAALLAAFGGDAGGPLADLAQLIGERVAVERAPISHEIVDGAGTLTVGDKIHCAMHPYVGPDGSTTKLLDSIFSTVPGSPAYVAKADSQRVEIPEHGYTWSYEGKNAIQSDWKIDYSGE
jgi:hypothetical protein